MNSDVEEIKTRLNIVDVLRDYIRLEKAGANWRALCPFHNEKTPSFMVSEDKQMWHCFGCQKGGDVFGFVMEIEGLEFKEALKILAEKAGVELKRTNPKLAAEKNKTLEILELATKFYETQLWKGEGQVKIINYLKERGLKDETIREFRLGYAPRGWRNLLTFLVGRGYTEEEVMKTGLLVQKNSNSETRNPKQIPNLPAGRQGSKFQIQNSSYYDRFRDRIIFPVADTNSKVVGFSARVAPGGDESQAKYVNTPETEVYHKSKILYGIDKAKQAMRQKDEVLLVEGNVDVLASWQAGLPNTVAVSGTALTPDQIQIIKRYTPKVKMFFDMDKAGEQATKKSLKLCLEQEMAVDVVELSEGKDAAELAQKDPAALQKAVADAPEAMEYFLQKTLNKYDKNKTEGKKSASTELLEMIGAMANQIEKGHWLKKIGQALEVSESVLTDMLKKATLKERISGNAIGQIHQETSLPKSKAETLLHELAGLMLVSAEVWKKIAEVEVENIFLQKDSLLNSIIQKGAAADFNFELFLKTLDAPEIAAAAERAFFEKKYRLDLNNNLEEIILADPLSEMECLLKEIQKEIRKEELDKIRKDLTAAEKEKDQEAIQFLRLEVKKISEELASF